MKTPEEIKKGLKLCLTHGACYICPYDDMTKDCDVCRPRLVADVEAYIQQLEAQVPRWISVEERLPKVCEDVLVWSGGKIDIGYYDGVWWETYTNGAVPTHWMPMPEPPKEAR